MLNLRFDRLLTVALYRALPRQGEYLPILMYHSISDDEEKGVWPYYRVATSPSRFEEQMRWLVNNGWKGVSLEEALPLFSGGQCDNYRPVAITFDDGFRDFYTAAWPVLQRCQFTATMYLPTASVAVPRRSFRGKECLTWEEVRELRAQGVRFGSHTVHHPKLHALSWAEITNELAWSRDQIGKALGEEIAGFAYPYAFPQEDEGFTERLAGVLHAQGYHHAVTTVVGRNLPTDDLFGLKRLPVNSCDDKALFLAKLEGSYDWVGAAQSVGRRLKAGARRLRHGA